MNLKNVPTVAGFTGKDPSAKGQKTMKALLQQLYRN